MTIDDSGSRSDSSSIFAVEIAAYAIMSNHVHVVLRMAPEATAAWSEREVAERWLSVFGRNARREQLVGGLAQAAERLAQDARWVEARRRRLADLGWLMRAFKEPIARRANAEDDCTGAFWEGRFAAYPLLDQAALVACMVYVDLNPIRARIASTPETSTSTSARLRTRARQRTRVVRRARERAGTTSAATALATKVGVAPAEHAAVAQDAEHALPVARLARCVVRLNDAPAATPLSCDGYLTLLDVTARIVRSDTRGAIDGRLAAILSRLELRVEDWIAAMLGRGQMRGTAVGRASSRAAEAARRGLRWITNRCDLFARDAA